MKKRNWNKLYRTYQKRYAKQKAVSSRIGVGIEEKYTRSEFKVTYTAMEADFEASGKKVPNITQNMVRRQMKYEYSQGQARAIRQALSDADIKAPRYMELRKRGSQAVPKQFWDMIRDVRSELFAKGRSAEQVRKTISSTIFGS